ncbi:MAG TPA: hypothetical protein GXX14_13480 [Clostridiaceae bacterium]|nr:hypothetical protein [Clostridiaceae bacterium]
MGRLERFRELRKNRRRLLLLFFLSFLLFGSGIFVVDYTTNFLLKNERRLNIVAFHSEDTQVEIRIMNKSLRIDTKYLVNDIEYVKKRLKDIFAD